MDQSVENSEEGSSVISKLATLTGEELMYTFNIHHNELLENFDTKSVETQLQLMDVFQKYCQVSNFENFNVFQLAVPKFRQVFSDSIAYLDQTLRFEVTDDKRSRITSMFQVSKTILMCYIELLNNIESYKIPFVEVKEVIVDIANVLLIAFSHVKNYADIYKHTSQSVMEQMNSLFKECKELQEVYFNFMETILKNEESQNEDDTLIILNLTFDIAVSVSSMDLKTMVHIWKRYMLFLKSATNELRSKLDLSRIMTFIHDEFVRRVKLLCEEKDCKRRTILLKLIAFFLKLMFRFCEYLKGCLEKCYAAILKPIGFLYKISMASINLGSIDKQFSEEISRTLLPVLDELVGVLIPDPKFAHYFLRGQEKRSDFGVLLLLCIILQKLVSSEEEVQNFWLDEDLWASALQIISDCDRKLCYPVFLATPCISNQVPQHVSLYDALVVNISSLIVCSVTEARFYHLETVLVKYLLLSSIAVQLLVMDVWCILSRYGSPELCFQHISYLRSILHQISSEKPERLIIRSLIERLYAFLTYSQQREMLQNTDAANVDFVLFSNQIPGTAAKSAIEKLRILKDRSEPEDATVLRVVFIVRDSFSSLDLTLKSWIFDTLAEKWIIHNLINTLRHRNISVILESLLYLSASTAAALCYMNTDQVTKILSSLMLLSSSDSILIVLVVLNVLRAFAKYSADGPQKLYICQTLATAYRECLLSSNPMIKQFSLESFSYFSHITKHEEIIKLCVASNSPLKSDFSAYLKKELPHTSKNQLEKFLIKLFRYQPLEMVLDEPGEKGEPVPPLKKIKFDLLGKIVETEKAVADLLRLAQSTSLSEEEKNRLRELVLSARQLEKFF